MGLFPTSMMSQLPFWCCRSPSGSSYSTTWPSYNHMAVSRKWVSCGAAPNSLQQLPKWSASKADPNGLQEAAGLNGLLSFPSVISGAPGFTLGNKNRLFCPSTVFLMWSSPQFIAATPKTVSASKADPNGLQEAMELSGLFSFPSVIPGILRSRKQSVRCLRDWGRPWRSGTGHECAVKVLQHMPGPVLGFPGSPPPQRHPLLCLIASPVA